MRTLPFSTIICVLYNYLFVNKLFSYEASRKLWETCGPRHKFKQKYLGIKNLVTVVQTDLRRAQFYANFIRVLTFVGYGAASYTPALLTEEHNKLNCLHFPSLQVLKIEGMYREIEQPVSINPTDILVQYFHSNLQELTLGHGSQLSNVFFGSLERSCSRLKRLNLKDTTNNNVSEDDLSRFLASASALDTLDIRTNLGNAWTKTTFNTLADSCGTLKYLSLPELQVDWLDHQHSRTQTAFPLLLEFVGIVHEQDLESLSQYMPNLKSLELNFSSLAPSHHILAPISLFIHLKRLEVEFHRDSIFDGQELLLLSRMCPALKILDLGQTSVPNKGVTDEVINEVAMNLPDLGYCRLNFAPPYTITWSSSLFFLRHCKHLNSLYLPCCISWHEIIDCVELGIIFPNLEYLELQVDQNHPTILDIDNIGADIISALNASFISLFPSLKEEVAIRGTPWRWAFGGVNYRNGY